MDLCFKTGGAGTGEVQAFFCQAVRSRLRRAAASREKRWTWRLEAGVFKDLATSRDAPYRPLLPYWPCGRRLPPTWARSLQCRSRLKRPRREESGLRRPPPAKRLQVRRYRPLKSEVYSLSNKLGLRVRLRTISAPSKLACTFQAPGIFKQLFRLIVPEAQKRDPTCVSQPQNHGPSWGCPFKPLFMRSCCLQAGTGLR